jgi:hypothetical protein
LFSDFLDRDRLELANLYATLTTQTFVGINRVGPAVFKFKDVHGTDLHARRIAHTFFRVHFHLIHTVSLSFIVLI